MRVAALARLVRLSLARDRRGAFFSAFGVAMGVGALVFFVGLGLGVGRVIRERVFPADARLVEVVPPAVSLGSFLGGGRLDAAMVERLRGLGFPVRMDEVYALAGGAQLGRPHLARVMVERGWCLDVKQAFDRFLGSGKPAWVERFKLEGKDAIRLIHDAGGTATLAHPGSSKLERYDILLLARGGLDGLEVLHSDHNPSVRQRYLKYASEFDLVSTGGSDFHGEQVTPGRRPGDSITPPENLARLRARATSSSSPAS